jgi:transaldolase
MKDNPVKALAALGQSIWLDYIRRNLIVSGELGRLIKEDGLRGMTSNPSIFEKTTGAVACLAALGALIWQTTMTAPAKLLVLAAMAALAVLIEGSYRLAKRQIRLHE